jgi:hypothetical protein
MRGSIFFTESARWVARGRRLRSSAAASALKRASLRAALRTGERI